jgi:DNA-binding PadR family transcriptional regulator
MSRPRQTSETLDMLLLSLLTRGHALSGYDIAAWLKEPVPFIWPVKHSQIYPALARLEARGDIAGAWKEQKGRPNKKSYRLAKQGRTRLHDWLMQPRTSLTPEEAVLIAYNHNLVGTAAAVAALRFFRRQSEDEMHQIDGRWRAIAEDAADDKTGIRAPFAFGVAVRRARIDWCDWFEAEIAKTRRASKRRS